MKDVQKIYFDESGFTGDNLLHQNQTVFSYGSVATTDEKAEDFVNYLINKYKIQNGELKGGKLIKSTSGKKAIDELLTEFSGDIKASVHNKKYALAGKIFEYVFEPLIQEKSSLFYEKNFHKFISNILYVAFELNESGVDELFLDFENVVRGKKSIESSVIFSSENSNENPVMECIKDFIFINRNNIKNEVTDLHDMGAKKWTLDLTTTSLHALLAHWGMKFEQLDVYCDDSKPLLDKKDIFDAMIGREDKKFTTIGGRKSPLTFNLKREVTLANSKTMYGIQIADVVAAAAAHICEKDITETYAVKWRDNLEEYLIDASVFPEYKHIDLERSEVQLNSLILFELRERSNSQLNLTDGMDKRLMEIMAFQSMNPFSMSSTQ